ncbi:MAG: hypothetical protein IPH03_08515 [Tetrasphaera sp.]|nr:hypothetical protein [Tetrasphaera sp.]
MGVIGDAPIPGAFLRASEFQRRELLAGLIDVAGTIAPDGDIELSIAHPRLFDSVGELLTSLGLVWRVSPLPAPAGAAETGSRPRGIHPRRPHGRGGVPALLQGAAA